MNMTDTDFEAAMLNVGVDITCGACACQFYTGSNGYAHEETCATTAFSTKGLDITADNVIESAGKELGKVFEVRDGDVTVTADYAIVTITYFKDTGKYYTEEKEKWYRDPTHYSKWKKFDDVPRIKDMLAVCIDTPLGFPHIRQPGVSRG
jgi:hypothetical protein